MDSSEIKNYVMDSLCRICAERSTKLIPIFEIKLLPLKIHKCLPIKITTGDYLPIKVCEICLSKIDESYLLYETCYNADQRLKRLWKTLTKQSMSDSEFFSNDNTKINSHSFQDESGNGSVPENDCEDSSKKVPINIILVNDVAMFDPAFEHQDFQLRARASDVLSPSDIVINMIDEEVYSNLGSDSKDQTTPFVDDGVLNMCKSELPENVSSKCNLESNPDMKPSSQNQGTRKEGDQEEKQIPVKIFQCRFCPLQLNTLSNLNSHESAHSQGNSFLCDTCGKSFKHANNLKNHAKIHSPHRKKYVCKICSKTFYTNFFLQEHMNTHTGETPYKCAVCNKEFREKIHLRQHKWTHSSEKFLCPVCGNHFNRKGNMTEHIKKYHCSNDDENEKIKKCDLKKSSEVKFTCSICSKTFSSQGLLKNHHKRHQKKELHFCSLCGKQFRYSGSLTYHRRTAHTGEKPFQCSYCEERFSLRSVQRIHERKKHTFEYPYKCQFCSRMFNNSSSLKNHSYVHMKEKMFACDVCGKKFSRNSNLFVHKKIHTDDRQYTCEHCGKSYIQKNDMIKHKKVHDPKSKPFFCKYCGNNFAHKRDFAKHAICHFDYIRKSNSDTSNAEKILDTVTSSLQKNSRTLIDESFILESTRELLEEKLEKSDIT